MRTAALAGPTVLLVVVAWSGASAQEVEVERIAPGVVSTDGAGEALPALSPDGGELWFSRYEDGAHHTLMVSRRVGGSDWGVPEVAPFSGTHSDRAPFFAPDGSRLLFASDRPLPEVSGTAGGAGTRPGDAGTAAGAQVYHLWSVERRGDGGWAEPAPLPRPVNGDSSSFDAAVTEDGTIYFSAWKRPGGHGESDLLAADPRPDGKGYGPAVILPAPWNGPTNEFQVFVDPGETILAFTSIGRSDGIGGDDLYVSWREGDGWTAPEPLPPPVNTEAHEYGPFVDPYGEYLWFTSDRDGTADLYRVWIRGLSGGG